MEALGVAGNLYIVILLAILVLGSGVIGFNFSKGLWEKTEKIIDNKGGKKMNKWFKLAATSFAGIVIATFALGLTSTAGGSEHDHAAHTAGAQSNASGTGAVQNVNYGTTGGFAAGYSASGYDAQLYQIQYNMMLLQQQLQQTQSQLNAQQMNGMNSMNGNNMGNMNTSGSSGGGGMSMM